MVGEEVIDLTPRPVARRSALNERLLDAAANVTRTNVLAVVGPQGGAGKTRITFALGSALAQLVGLNVVAMDLDDDYGALLDLVPEKTRRRLAIESLLDQHDAAVPYPQLRAWASVTRSRMLVLRGPEQGTTDLDAVLEKLSNADVVILDCAAGVDRPRARWALSQADQVVVVARPEPSGAHPAAAATDRALRSVSAPGCLVINRKRARTDVSTAETAFTRIGCLQDVVHVPESYRFAHSLEGGSYRIEYLGPRTRRAITELAAAVGDRLL